MKSFNFYGGGAPRLTEPASLEIKISLREVF